MLEHYEQKPKKRAIRDALFERKLLQWNMLINQNGDSEGDIILAVQSMCYVRSLFKITLYFQGFSRKKGKCQFRKILVTFNAMGSWHILLISLAAHTCILRKVETMSHYWQPGKNKPWQKRLHIQAKSCDFILNPAPLFKGKGHFFLGPKTWA